MTPTDNSAMNVLNTVLDHAIFSMGERMLTVSLILTLLLLFVLVLSAEFVLRRFFIKRALKTPANTAYFEAFGDSSLWFELGVWTSEMTHSPRRFRSDINFVIETPFPQQELHLKSENFLLPQSSEVRMAQTQAAAKPEGRDSPEQPRPER